MAKIRVGKTDYEWPESGEKNWGTDVTHVVQAIASETTRNGNSSAQSAGNNVFTGANRFHSAPTVGLTKKDAVSVATANDILTASSALQTEVNIGLTVIEDFLGAGNNPSTSDLFGVNGFSDFFKTLGDVSNSASNATLLNILNAMMGYLRALVPIGKIEAGYHNSDQRFPLLQWEAVGTGDVQPDENSVWLHNPPLSADWLVAASNNSGWYRPVFDTGIWSVCSDGKTPLPFGSFGQDGYWDSGAGPSGTGKHKPFFIPDLTSAFLQGATAGTETTHGDNTMTLTVPQIPAHNHDLDLSGYRVTGSIGGGEHKHYTTASAYNRHSGNDKSVHTMSFHADYGLGKLDEVDDDILHSVLTVPTRTYSKAGENLSDFGQHTHMLSTGSNVRIEKSSSDSEVANTGEGVDVDVGNALKRLPVKFYMKVAE